MSQYRKKPVVIDAFPVAEALKAAGGDWGAMPSWLASAYEDGKVIFAGGEVHISTLENRQGEWMVASYNDWIIRGVKGELYPCRPDIFEATYEPVGEGVLA